MKQAYLIIAHNEFELLSELVKLLDFDSNDIYIHIDKKVDIEILKCINIKTENARVNIFSEISVNWGDESQARVEIFLLKQALAVTKYDYYHILSGVDLPIKTHREIEDFLNQNKGKQFIQFESEKIKKRYLERIEYRHFFSKWLKKSRFKVIRKSMFLIDDFLVILQKMLRLKKKHSFNIIQKGCNWVSITDDFANYIILNEKKIEELITKSLCVDEIFIHTLCVNSRFVDSLYSSVFDDNYHACIREIIWESDSSKAPVIFSERYWEMLKKSNCLFARKFSMEEEPEFTKKWIDYIKKSQEE